MEKLILFSVFGFLYSSFIILINHLKLGTAKVGAKLEEITRVIDASNLNHGQKEKVERHDVAECIIKLDRAIACDLAEDFAHTSRFVIIDDYEIAGGGIVQEALEDKQTWVRQKVYQRNIKWAKSFIADEERAEKYNQKSTLILLTGKEDAGKKAIAKALESRLFHDGKLAYFLGIGSFLYGIDADLMPTTSFNKVEHFRRLAELSHIMLDAGMILIVSARELTQEDLEIIKTTINPEKIQTVWVGEDITTDLSYDLHIPDFATEEQAVDKIKRALQDRGIIFKPW